MNDDLVEHRTPDGKSPTSVQLLRSPIDFIAEDHLRLRTMCAEMDRLADAGGAEPDALAELRDYLTNELPLLLADEDHTLMPLVLERAQPEDELPKLVRRLEREHAEIEAHLGEVFSALSKTRAGTAVSEELRIGLRSLAAATRRHLFLENAVLLPLARARLTPPDLEGLRQKMLQRRGLGDLFAN